ncbi:GFA family protein [Chelativorans sp. AA-79]|uniref:GFA family protein n=1 Tax=Chelativorans sp. AA-79 TaxID=3028735 RepID=UPI0023F830E9|nr:GFA family protein [Chelativorans sp. AA-79]WEX11571.1 GFA family protein [Chelativorans sp. AA-79]
MSEIRHGACLCGAVHFRAAGKLRGVVYCHCSQCRRQTGHHYAATDVEDARLTIEGAENLTWYAASDFARRGFCRICGSALFWKRNDADVTSIMAGSFDRPSGLKAEAHIFVADKGDYYEITDGLPQYARSSPSVPVAEEAPENDEGRA